MTNTTGNNDGYKNFTSKVATVIKGSTNQLLVSAGFWSGSYNEYFVIWIDYNNDGDFSDSGEKVASGNSNSTDNRSSNVTIPSTAKLGLTRMRVAMKYGSAPTACESFNYGEVEDYAVNITTSSSKTTGIADAPTLRNENIIEISAFPNPASDFIQIKLASRASNSTFKIINTIGRVVKAGHLGEGNINISNLNTGMYILEVNDGHR